MLFGQKKTLKKIIIPENRPLLSYNFFPLAIAIFIFAIFLLFKYITRGTTVTPLTFILPNILLSSFWGGQNCPNGHFLKCRP